MIREGNEQDFFSNIFMKIKCLNFQTKICYDCMIGLQFHLDYKIRAQ